MGLVDFAKTVNIGCQAMAATISLGFAYEALGGIALSAKAAAMIGIAAYNLILMGGLPYISDCPQLSGKNSFAVWKHSLMLEVIIPAIYCLFVFFPLHHSICPLGCHFPRQWQESIVLIISSSLAVVTFCWACRLKRLAGKSNG